MVKLLFKPTETTHFAESVISKKKEQNLHPFSEVESFITSTENTFLKVKDIIGLENCAYVLNNWYNNDNSKILLIIGPTGCGKTTLIESYCRENSIQLYSVKPSDSIKTKKDLLKNIFTFSECSSSSFFVKRQNVNKKLIFFDEYQNGANHLLTISDINNLHLLRNQKSREENKKELKVFLNELECPFTIPPIIIIGADSKGSKLCDIKKNHNVYYINQIPSYIIKSWINKTCSFDENILNEIITRCKSDKRLILNTINFISKNCTTQFNNFIESFYKDEDITIFNFLDSIFSIDQKIDDIFKIYETDGFMLGNLIHENYIDYNSDIDLIANSAESISMGETLFSDTYESNKSFIPELHCLHSVYMPSFYLKSDKLNKNIRTSCINNRYNIFLNNKKILAKINNKHGEFIKNFMLDIFDIFTIKKILTHSLVKSKIINEHQEDFLKNLLSNTGTLEKMELIYKHFSEFNSKETKTKNFTLKFKEKLKKLN